MSYINAQRKSFCDYASLKLSTMLEERLFDNKTQEDFVTWCEEVYENEDCYDIASHVLSEFQGKILELDFVRKPLYKVKKGLIPCFFAKDLYNHITK